MSAKNQIVVSQTDLLTQGPSLFFNAFTAILGKLVLFGAVEPPARGVNGEVA